MKTRARALMLLGAIAAATQPLEANGATVYTFISGPAVISYTNSGAFPSNSTIIFGRERSDLLRIIAYAGSWRMWDGHHLYIAGGYDGDPAAAYLRPDGSSNVIMNCGHAATGPGYMYCARAQLHREAGGHYETLEIPTKSLAALSLRGPVPFSST